MDATAWDARYSSSELVWGAGPNQFLVQQVEQLAPGRALDLACGEGRNAIWLAEQGWKVTGADFSAAGLTKARRLAAERGADVEWVHADATTWDTPKMFDLVAVLYLQLPAGPRRQALAAAARAVAGGGSVLVVAHDRSNLHGGFGGPQDPAVLYEPDDVVEDLRTAVGDALQVERAGQVQRVISTDGGDATAIDLLVRATVADRS